MSTPGPERNPSSVKVDKTSGQGKPPAGRSAKSAGAKGAGARPTGKGPAGKGGRNAAADPDGTSGKEA